MTWEPWDGAFNLFDAGGVLTSRGVTRSGVVFRSGRPETLTDQGWQDARRDGLRTIIDLRNERERGRRDHDPVIDEAAAAGILVIATPTEDPDDAEFMRVCGPWLDHPRSYADNLTFYPDRFRAVFVALARAEPSVLIHCSGGRDRTGMIVALLLSLAGASPSAIADDYERSFREAWIYQSHHPELAHEPPRTPAEMDARIAERRTAMIEWIGGFDVADYLDELGLSAVEIATLEALLN